MMVDSIKRTDLKALMLSCSMITNDAIHDIMLRARLVGHDKKKSFAANVFRVQPAHRPAIPPARLTTEQKPVKYAGGGLAGKKSNFILPWLGRQD